MSTIDLTLIATPINVTGMTVEQMHQAIIGSITTASTSSSILLGTSSSSMPLSDVGPWMNDGAWFYHNGSTYVPTILQIGDDVNQITLTGTPSSNRSIVFPDKDGTVALLSDVYDGGRGTDYPTIGATTTIDWDVAASFSIPLDKDTSILNLNSKPGQDIFIGIYNPASWTASWASSNINWGTTGAPTSPTTGKTSLISVRNIGGGLYGKLEVANA